MTDSDNDYAVPVDEWDIRPFVNLVDGRTMVGVRIIKDRVLRLCFTWDDFFRFRDDILKASNVSPGGTRRVGKVPDYIADAVERADLIEHLAEIIDKIAYLPIAERMRNERLERLRMRETDAPEFLDPAFQYENPDIDLPEVTDDAIRLEWAREKARAIIAELREIGLIKEHT